MALSCTRSRLLIWVLHQVDDEFSLFLRYEVDPYNLPGDGVGYPTHVAYTRITYVDGLLDGYEYIERIKRSSSPSRILGERKTFIDFYFAPRHARRLHNSLNEVAPEKYVSGAWWTKDDWA